MVLHLLMWLAWPCSIDGKGKSVEQLSDPPPRGKGMIINGRDWFFPLYEWGDQAAERRYHHAKSYPWPDQSTNYTLPGYLTENPPDLQPFDISKSNGNGCIWTPGLTDWACSPPGEQFRMQDLLD